MTSSALTCKPRRPLMDLFPVLGRQVALRLVRPGDAAFVHGLRCDPAYNTHLSAVTGTVDDQRAWILRYLEREAAGQEIYCVIERIDGLPCGLVRLYDIADDQFTWGSWILNADKPQKAALESAVLSFGLGFRQLNLPVAYVDVRIHNAKARAFYSRLGMQELRRDEQDIYFVYHRAMFEKDVDALRSSVDREART